MKTIKIKNARPKKRVPLAKRRGSMSRKNFRGGWAGLPMMSVDFVSRGTTNRTIYALDSPSFPSSKRRRRSSQKISIVRWGAEDGEEGGGGRRERRTTKPLRPFWTGDEYIHQAQLHVACCMFLWGAAGTSVRSLGVWERVPFDVCGWEYLVRVVDWSVTKGAANQAVDQPSATPICYLRTPSPGPVCFVP